MQEKLPNVRRKKIWGILAVIVALAFFILWSLPGGNTPAVIEHSREAPTAATIPSP